MRYFVTAIDTDSGKTLVSAILCEALQSDYWKPIQAGLPKDSGWVKSMVGNPKTKILPERFMLTSPMSPHAAAKIDKVSISLNDFIMPDSADLVIEGAGGVLVPINEKNFIVDLIGQFNVPVIVVADIYLGSINHTLLTLEALSSRGATVKGIIFNGDSNPESERIILEHSRIKCLLKIPRLEKIDRPVIAKFAEELKMKLDA
jgi:dethiobiotin synthetase